MDKNSKMAIAMLVLSGLKSTPGAFEAVEEKIGDLKMLMFTLEGLKMISEMADQLARGVDVEAANLKIITDFLEDALKS